MLHHETPKTLQTILLVVYSVYVKTTSYQITLIGFFNSSLLSSKTLKDTYKKYI